jgi:hypothetical protein
MLLTQVGEHYSLRDIASPEWAQKQLDPACGQETWVAESSGRLQACVTLLLAQLQNPNPVINLGRQIFGPESFENGAAAALLQQVNAIADERKKWLVARVLGSDNAQQILFERLGYICAGFQPSKHQVHAREGVLFYVRIGKPDAAARYALSESLPMINELAVSVLERLRIPSPLTVRDGATGYPLQSELAFHDATFDDFELWRVQAQSSNPPVEISSGYSLGRGILRVEVDAPPRAILGQRDERIVAGLAYLFDESDRCVRVIDAFCSDDFSTGAMLSHALKISQEQLAAVFVEIDIVMTATRLLKSAEQMGFVPVAYLPAFFFHNGQCFDVVKLMKMNVLYSQDNMPLTSEARAVVNIVDHNFEDQKVGVAIINLLRCLPIFTGLGEGELRKIARLFSQKLFRPGELVFRQGDRSDEAYVVMRGAIDIFLEDEGQAVASIKNGQIFGEQAFLDGAVRGATAKASQASILLTVLRSSFNELVQREPHLGMVIMRNTAVELSNKLRRADALLSAVRKHTV